MLQGKYVKSAFIKQLDALIVIADIFSKSKILDLNVDAFISIIEKCKLNVFGVLKNMNGNVESVTLERFL